MRGTWDIRDTHSRPVFFSMGCRLRPNALLLIILASLTLTACGGGSTEQQRPDPRAIISLSAATLSFSSPEGGPNAANQTFTLSNTGSATLNFTATAAPTAPPAWLAVAPTSGSMAAGVSTTLNVSVNTSGLAVGAYTSSLSVSDAAASNSPQSVSVSLVVTEPLKRVSVASDDTEGNGSSTVPKISRDGRFIVFTSDASNLVDADTNSVSDVFVRDRQTGQTTRVSVASDGTEGNGASATASISADGRFVAFTSKASNLVPDDTNDSYDIFLRDTCGGDAAGCAATTVRVSVASDGTGANLASRGPSISADGRFVAFWSSASNLVAGDTNGTDDVFVHDTCFGTAAGCTPATERVSVASDGTEAVFGGSDNSSISADGRFVAFKSNASNLVAGDTNGIYDVFVHDRETDRTTRVSVASDGTEGDNGGDGPSISADGRFVAFSSGSTNLVPDDTNACFAGKFVLPCGDIFVRDTCVGASAGCSPSTIRVSVASDGSQSNDVSSGPSISADGRFVAFWSSASNLVPDDTNDSSDVFLRDTCRGAAVGCTPSTVRVSVATDGTEGNGSSGNASMTGDGRFVAFDSFASNLVAGDSNGSRDIFVANTR